LTLFWFTGNDGRNCTTVQHCQNCGMSTHSRGICGRCLDLPWCKSCKRHLPSHCFDDEQKNICQVDGTISSSCVYKSRLAHVITVSVRFPNYTLFCTCMFQACARRKHSRGPRVDRAVDGVVTEVHIPSNAMDTSFTHFVERNRHHINEAINEHHHRFGYVYI